MPYLDDINNPQDIKNLNIEQLEILANEIRYFLVSSLSKTGGHLASNLGVVELTLALNYCFDFSNDKIIWDVGHQVYTHKILTGRKDKFNTLRKKGGLSGFPKTKESKYDHFNTGHSSTSISAGLGFATARDLNSKQYNVVSVIGDGAMTGGLVYEAMNNVGANNKKLVIILNDNQMSISENVGSMSKHLSALRTAPFYIEAKGDIRSFLRRFNIVGDTINKFLEKAKEGIKYAILPNVMFEQLGIKYIGPIDGHDIEGLIKALNNVKTMDKPVLIHIITKKGYGYLPAEREPFKYHGVSAFDLETGETKIKGGETFSDVFGKFMVREANKNKKLIGITAAMPSGTGLIDFSKIYPDRLFDVGIAEEHAVVFAGGLAVSGFIPVFAVYSTFLQRGYDQIIHDICIQNLHVVFAIDRAGVVGDDGETHQGIFDISYLSHIPNMTVIAPKNREEFLDMLHFAINIHNGPIAIRYPKALATDICSEYNKQDIKFSRCEILEQKGRVAIISVGAIMQNVKPAYDKLVNEGYEISLINARFISPIDKRLIENIKRNFDYVFTVEDNILKGGFGQNLVATLIQNEVFNKKIYNIAYPDEYIEHSSICEIHKKYGLDVDGIYNFVKGKLVCRD